MSLAEPWGWDDGHRGGRVVMRSNYPGTSREGQDEVGEAGPALDGRCNCLWPQPFSSCTSVARQSSLTAWVLRVMPTVIWGTTEKRRERKCDKKITQGYNHQNRDQNCGVFHVAASHAVCSSQAITPSG